jgi:hypothetical protein
MTTISISVKPVRFTAMPPETTHFKGYTVTKQANSHRYDARQGYSVPGDFLLREDLGGNE